MLAISQSTTTNGSSRDDGCERRDYFSYRSFVAHPLSRHGS